MKEMHLTERTLKQLLSGALEPAEARELARHLEGDCEVCEGFLAAAGRADAADGAVDEVLTRLAPVAAEERGNDLEYGRIRRARLAGRPGGSGRMLRLAAVAAAVLAVGGVAFEVVRLERRSAPGGGREGVKGAPSRAIPIRLRFLVVHPAETGRPPELEKGASGAVLDPLDALEFQVELGGPGHAALVRAGPSGDLDLFWSGYLSRAGSLDVSLGDRPAAYPLAGLAGPQRIVLVASPAPLGREEVLAAARVLAPPARISAESPSLEGLSIDVVEVSVR